MMGGTSNLTDLGELGKVIDCLYVSSVLKEDSTSRDQHVLRPS